MIRSVMLSSSDGWFDEVEVPLEEEKRIQADLQAKRAALATVQQAVAADKQRIQKISDIKTRLLSFKSRMTRFYSELAQLLKDVGIPEAETGIFQPKFLVDTDDTLDRRSTELNAAIAKQEGDAEKPAEGTIRWLEGQIKALAARESADKARQQKIGVIQTRIGPALSSNFTISFNGGNCQ